MTTNKRAKQLFVFVVMMVFAFTATPESWARPASPFPFSVTQPDGITIELYRRGDESRNWVEDRKGYSLARNSETGFWEYALLDVRSAEVDGKTRYWLTLIPSGVEYNPSVDAPDGWPSGLRPTRAPGRFRK